mmetsp:Transcript_23504/g.37764  ORF Transcript_23504/g.37764 Transcript_23504/m.37764 type:complete len:445 (+) Transcript_23504:143-1477(+)
MISSNDGENKNKVDTNNLARVVQEYIAEGIQAVCGNLYTKHVMSYRRARVKRCQSKTSGDFETHAAKFIFHDLAKGKGSATVSSDLGLTREFLSPLSLAHAFIEALPIGKANNTIHLVECMSRKHGAPIMVINKADKSRNQQPKDDDDDDDSETTEFGQNCVLQKKQPKKYQDAKIIVITTSHLEMQKEKGLVLCKDCARFFKGNKGLRLHQQIAHEAHYGEAKSIADSLSKQLIVYSPPRVVVSPKAKEKEKEHAQSVAAVLLKRENSRHHHDCSKHNRLHPGLAAARDGDLEKMRKLVKLGEFDPKHTIDRHGSTALLWAAGSGHLHVCKWLVAAAAVPVDFRQKKDGRNALHWACRNGHLEVCKWLLARGGEGNLDVNLGTRDGTTPLHWAVWKGHHHVCRWLVEEAKADIHAKNSYGCNAMQFVQHLVVVVVVVVVAVVW